MIIAQDAMFCSSIFLLYILGVYHVVGVRIVKQYFQL